MSRAAHAMMRMESMCEARFAKMARTRLCQYANVMMMDIARGASVMAVSDLNGGCHGGPFVPDRQPKRWEEERVAEYQVIEPSNRGTR